MECDFCSREPVGQDDFQCASCARTSVYMSRLEIARLLLENEHLHQQVSTIVTAPTNFGVKDTNIQQAQDSWREGRTNAERSIVQGRIDGMRSRITALKQEMDEMRTDMSQRKKSIETRRNAMNTINNAVPNRRQTSINTLTEVREKGTTSFSNISSRSAKTRAFLCRETADLLRLRQIKRSKNGGVVEQYSITGSILPDLKEINNVRCTDLTASLTSATHLLVLVAFYLGVRLPAEITTPHRDYPLPTINTPARSYLGQKIAFPGSGSIGTAPSSPFSSRHEAKIPYRPRPLFIGSDDRDEKVAQFAKKDPSAFNFFVEGIALLAWNVAWLCRTQGFSQGTTTWEDVCHVGRNLHQLILGNPQPPALLRVLSSREAQKRQKQYSGTSTPSQDGNIPSFAKLGQASHLSTNAFLGQASFNEQFRTWKYSKYNTIADALKKLLVTEMNNAEWELLQEQEWDDGGEQFDEAVFIKAKATDGREVDDARSVMTTRTAIEEQTQQSSTDREQGKPKGRSGWTKVKSRSDG